MKLTFNTRYEQLEYEIDNLVRTSRDPQFTNYLKGLIYDARTNPADIPKMRRDLISGYDMYSSRMAQMGIPVEPMFFRAIYGNMEAPEVLEDKIRADMQSEEVSEAASGQTAEAAQNTDTYQNTEAVQNAASMEEAAQDTDSIRTAGADRISGVSETVEMTSTAYNAAGGETSNDPAVTQSYIPTDVPQYNSSQDYSADSVPQYNSSQDYSADSVPQYNNPQDHIADSVPQYGVSQDAPRYNGFQGQPQQAYAPQYTYPQQNPQTASVITSPKAEYAIGAIVMSVLGSVFLLTGLVYFAVNYLDSFAQGMIMYAVCALVLLVSEFVIRRVVPKLSAVFTAIGISGVFLTTVVNYKSLGNISLGIAAVLLALCSALVCLFGYVRKSQLYSVIGFLAAFISSVAIGNHVNPVEFIAITVGTLIISTMWLFFPASGRKDVLTPVMILAELMYFLATSTFDIETPDVAMAVVSRIIFAAASWLVICLIYFVSDNWSSKRSNNDQTVDTVNLVIYLISAFVYGLAIRIMFEARHLLVEDSILYGVIVYTVIVVPQIIFAFVKMSKKRDAAIAYYISALMTGFLIIGCTDTRFITVPVIVLYSLVARFLAKKNPGRLCFSVIDIVVQSIYAIMAFGYADEVYIASDGFEACFVGLLLLIGLFGGIFINSGFKTAVQIMFVFAGCFTVAGVFLPHNLGDPAAMGIVLLFTYLINNVGNLKGRGFKVYNYFMLVFEMILLITSSHMDLSGENLLIFSISAIFGLAFVILMMNREYGMFFAGYYIVIPVYLTLVAMLLPIRNGFIMSIILMAIAVVSVIIGFALREKAIRIYGLVLSILICGKIALVDFVSFGSARSKILMYILVGALALVIGCIYMVLESRENKKRNQNDSQ